MRKLVDWPGKLQISQQYRLLGVANVVGLVLEGHSDMFVANITNDGSTICVSGRHRC